MLDYEIYLEKLSLFGRILREQGLEVSPKELEDACRMILELGVEDRTVVKTMFRSIFAKSKEEQIRFDRAFDGFFLSEEMIRALYKKYQDQVQQRQESIEQAEIDMKGQADQYTDEEKEAYAALPDDVKKKLQDTQERYSDPQRGMEKLYNNFINSIFKKYILEEQMRMEDAAVGREQAIDPELGLMFRDISEFQDHEIPKAVMYIQTLATRIKGEMTKNQRAVSHSSVLDFRRTIRKGLESGGSFYNLAYKQRKNKRKHLVLVCDVSASMIQFSEFALRFIRELNQSAESSRVVLFSEDSQDADPFHLQNMDLFRDYIKTSGLYGRGTDLGKALKKLNDERPAAFSSSSIVIIVSDGKTVNVSGCREELLRTRSRAGKVILLNPIPQRKWKYSPTIQNLAECCNMLSCSTLEELGEACRRLVLM